MSLIYKQALFIVQGKKQEEELTTRSAPHGGGTGTEEQTL